MFLDNLSTALLQICAAEHLGCEWAAERCNGSFKHFSNIVCRRSCPPLHVFEQICLGLHAMPNRLLSVISDERSLHTPLFVAEAPVFSSATEIAAYPVCPRTPLYFGAGVRSFLRSLQPTPFLGRFQTRRCYFPSLNIPCIPYFFQVGAVAPAFCSQALISLFRFRADADKRHCSNTFLTPLFRVNLKLWQRFCNAKFPSHTI